MITVNLVNKKKEHNIKPLPPYEKKCRKNRTKFQLAFMNFSFPKGKFLIPLPQSSSFELVSNAK